MAKQSYNDNLDWMRPNLWKENESLKCRFIESRPLAQLIDEVGRMRLEPKTRLQKNVIQKWEELNGWGGGLPFCSLKQAYLKLNEHLNHIYRLSVAKPTPAEHRYAKDATEKLRRRFFRSIFIGPYQCDFLIMGLRAFNDCSGMVIEIDGDCHNRESKMTKDSLKHHYLQGFLRIGVRAITNEQVYRGNHLPELVEFDKMAKPSSRAIKRKWRRVYSETLAFGVYDSRTESFTKDLLSATFQLSWLEISSLVELVKCSKSQKKDYVNFDIAVDRGGEDELTV